MRRDFDVDFAVGTVQHQIDLQQVWDAARHVSDAIYAAAVWGKDRIRVDDLEYILFTHRTEHGAAAISGLGGYFIINSQPRPQIS